MSGTHESTTDTGVEDERDDDLPGALDESDVEDAFLTTLRDGDEPTTDPEGGTEPGGDEPVNSEADSQAEAEKPSREQRDDAKKPLAGDDAIVEFKVGDETHRVPVRDLKRLAGQEAALTRRSQEVAQARTEAIAQAESAKTVLSKALERAQARFKPYQEVDFWKASRELPPDAFEQLRKDAAEARDELAALQGEAESVDATLKATRSAETATRAAEAIKALTTKDSPHFIEGWSPELYGELLTFSRDQGFDAVHVVDPAAIKLIRMAMLYERGRAVVRNKVTAVAAQPRSPLRAGPTGSPSTPRRTADAAVSRLQRSGHSEDAEAAFLSRLRRDDD